MHFCDGSRQFLTAEDTGVLTQLNMRIVQTSACVRIYRPLSRLVVKQALDVDHYRVLSNDSFFKHTYLLQWPSNTHASPRTIAVSKIMNWLTSEIWVSVAS